MPNGAQLHGKWHCTKFIQPFPIWEKEDKLLYENMAVRPEPKFSRNCDEKTHPLVTPKS